MADPVVYPTVTAHHSVGKWDLVIGTLAVAAGTYTSGGVVVTFELCPGIKSSLPPVAMLIEGIAGFIYRYIPGATKNVGKMKILQSAGSAAPLVEETAVDAEVAADTIRFVALFPLLR